MPILFQKNIEIAAVIPKKRLLPYQLFFHIILQVLCPLKTYGVLKCYFSAFIVNGFFLSHPMNKVEIKKEFLRMHVNGFIFYSYVKLEISLSEWKLIFSRFVFSFSSIRLLNFCRGSGNSPLTWEGAVGSKKAKWGSGGCLILDRQREERKRCQASGRGMSTQKDASPAPPKEHTNFDSKSLHQTSWKRENHQLFSFLATSSHVFFKF